jgi:uncharacterized membrane protein
MDALLFIIFAQTIAVENRMGIGWFKDQRYIFFGFLSATIYLLFHLLELKGYSKLSLYGKFITLGIFLFATIIGVGGSYMQARYVSGTDAGISDSGMQTELGGKLLVLGQNPYTVDYFKTDLAKIPYSDELGNKVNPALYYFVYPPMVPIISAASYKLIAPRLNWFDIRVVFIAFLLILLILGYIKWGISQTYLLYLVTVGANPYFIRTIFEGSNDIFAMVFFVTAILILEKKKSWIIAAILYALSISSKQIIWPTVLFMIVGLWKQYGFKVMSRFMILTGLVTLVIFLPFIIWDFPKLYAGLLGFHSGTLTHSYPIHNFGFGMMLVQLGIVSNIYNYYNFALWQAGGIAVLGFVLFKIYKLVSSSIFILAGWTGSLFILFLFNRSMNYSYLGVMQVALAITVCFAFPQISDKIKQEKSIKRNSTTK